MTMPKRFTSSEKWDKLWFQQLTPRLKCFWDYLYTRCDLAGIWEPNYIIASAYIGEAVTADDLRAFGDRVEVIESGKVWLTTFCKFQYGELSKDCKPHVCVINRLAENGLFERVCHRVGPSVGTTLQDKEKDKDKEQDKEKERKKDVPSVGEREAEAIYSHYPRKVARIAAIKAIVAALKKRGCTHLLDRTKAYGEAVARWPDSEKQYIPHPATWYNQGRYDDDPATWARNNNPRDTGYSPA